MMVGLGRSVTVVVPTIPGREQLLREAVGSVYQQTEHHHGELHLYIQLDADGEGAATTRNRALERVTTEWVAFLDDDDLLYPEHLEVCLNAAQESGADLVYPYPDFGDNRDPLATLHQSRVVLPFGVPFGPEQEWWLRNRGNFIPVTHLCRAKLAKQVGGFPQPGQFRVSPANSSGDCEDFGLLLRLLNAGARFHHVPKKTWYYRLHGGNTGGRPGWADAGVAPAQ